MKLDELKPWQKRHIEKMSRRFPKAARKKRVINKWKNSAKAGLGDYFNMVYTPEIVEELIFNGPGDVVYRGMLQ